MNNPSPGLQAGEIIPYSRQWLDEDDIAAVVDVLRSDWLTTGPEVEKYEKAFAEKVGAKYAVAASSGTAALHLAVLAAGVRPGDTVITSPLTFVATANAVKYCGAEPVFADVYADTLNIDIESLPQKTLEKASAVIAVDYAGQPCYYDQLREYCEQFGLVLIEDACHALGAAYYNESVGSIADLTCFSTHPVKSITTAEGGMVTTDDEHMAERMRVLRNHGRAAGDLAFILGYNYRLSDLHAALGLSQLKKLDRFVARRRRIADVYDEAFRDGPVYPLAQKPGRYSARHLYVVQVKPEYRDTFRRKLADRGVGTQIHYPPVFRLPLYAGLEANAYCPVADQAAESVVSIPLFPKMTDDEVEKVIVAVREAASAILE